MMTSGHVYQESFMSLLVKLHQSLEFALTELLLGGEAFKGREQTTHTLLDEYKGEVVALATTSNLFLHFSVTVPGSASLLLLKYMKITLKYMIHCQFDSWAMR